MARYYAKFVVGVTTFTDVRKATVRRSITQETGTFNIELYNTQGLYSSTFTVGDDVKIYCGSNNPASTQIFRGFVESIDFKSDDSKKEYLIISGRDYTARLNDVTINLIYNDTEASVIIKDMIDKKELDITYTNVDVTVYTPGHITFKGLPLSDCIRTLAEKAGYDFWVDFDKDLNLKQENSVSSGKTYDTTNVVDAKYREDDQEMHNKIWVYGGRQLVGWQNTFTADGAGSVFNLDYKPHNPYVTDGGVKKIGNVKEMSIAPSGIQYVWDYDQREIIFVSGTYTGDNIPTSGNSIVVDYKKSIPIVKYTEDRPSLDAYHQREKRITKREITDPRQARDLAISELALHKLPKQMGTIRLKNENTANPGETCVVNLPFHNISSETHKILNVTWYITKTNLLLQEVLTITTSERIKDISDVLKQFELRLRQLESRDQDPSDVLTRLEVISGSVELKNYSWYVKTRDISGAAVWNRPVQSWNQSGLAWNESGASFTWVNQRSGGTFS